MPVDVVEEYVYACLLGGNRGDKVLSIVMYEQMRQSLYMSNNKTG